MGRRIFYRGRYWVEEPPSGIGCIFLLLLPISLIWGCNQIIHRTPAEQAELRRMDEMWDYSACSDFKNRAFREGWTINDIGYESDGQAFIRDKYLGIKGDQKVTFSCRDETGKPQNVCFISSKNSVCSTRPQD